MHSVNRHLVCALIIVGFACFGQSAGKPVPVKKTTAELEAKLMVQFKAFAIRKRDYAKKIAAEKKVEPPELVWKFFDSAIAGDFVETQKQYRPLALMSGQYDAPPPLLGEAFWSKARPRIEKLFEVDLSARWRESIARRQQLNKEAFNVVWPLVNEVSGAMEALDGWHAKFLLLYMRDIVGSIPKDSIYFGGTDPGRYAITLGSKSHEKADPFFTITQNALADGSYLQYLRRLYGERIYIPSVEDNQNAQKRMVNGRLNPGENVTFKFNFKCPQCDTPHLILIDQSRLELHKKMTVQGGLSCPKDNTLMPTPAPLVQISGTGAVMAINELLAKKIFEKNPDHDFYLEESFPLPWMMPHMVPHGLIFKLESKPLKELHPDLIARSRKDWQRYMALCVGDAVVKPETTVAELCKWIELVYIKNDRDGFNGNRLFLEAKKEKMGPYSHRKGPPFSEQKSFSKMRSAQASLFAWREFTTQDAKLKTEYTKEADFAYRQAFALGPTNTEVAFKYVNFLSTKGRFDDAKLIGRTLKATDPNSKVAQILLTGILRNQERQLVAKRDYLKAGEVALELGKIDKENKDQHMKRVERYRNIK